LLVVAAIESHSSDPKVLKELGQDVLADELRLDALGADALLDDLEHDLLHLLIGARKLAHERRRHGGRVVARILGVHQRNDVADRLEEGRQRLATRLLDAEPQRPKHRVERLDTVR